MHPEVSAHPRALNVHWSCDLAGPRWGHAPLGWRQHRGWCLWEGHDWRYHMDWWPGQACTPGGSYGGSWGARDGPGWSRPLAGATGVRPGWWGPGTHCCLETADRGNLPTPGMSAWGTSGARETGTAQHRHRDCHQRYSQGFGMDIPPNMGFGSAISKYA